MIMLRVQTNSARAIVFKLCQSGRLADFFFPDSDLVSRPRVAKLQGSEVGLDCSLYKATFQHLSCLLMSFMCRARGGGGV